MAFDYKKEYREFYLPKDTPSIVTVPRMNYIAVRGHGDPNVEGGEYKLSIELLYGVAYTIKMSRLGGRRIDGYFDFVVPPLEGFWWQDGSAGIDYSRKASSTGSPRSACRLCDGGRPQLGARRGGAQKEAGLFQGHLHVPRGGGVRAVHAHRPPTTTSRPPSS